MSCEAFPPGDWFGLRFGEMLAELEGCFEPLDRLRPVSETALIAAEQR